jgi:hypothetical protein
MGEARDDRRSRERGLGVAGVGLRRCHVPCLSPASVAPHGVAAGDNSKRG